MMKLRFLRLCPPTAIVLVFISASSAASAQTVWYVDDDSCPTVGTGTKEVPFCRIQTAIHMAATTGDEIVVAPGTYYEAISILGMGVHLRSSGGADVTTIDAGGLDTTVVTCVDSLGNETMLEGFTITGGTGVLSANPGRGGGMHVARASPTIKDCTFIGNTANAGGALYADNEAAVTLINCILCANSATVRGGAVYNRNATLSAVGCTFTENHAERDGGGIRNNLGSASVRDCTFSGNTALELGGAIANLDSTIIVEDSLFVANEASTALYNENGTASVTNCDFIGNLGRGIASYDTDATVSSCDFEGNTAYSGGGIIHLGGQVRVTACNFLNNETRSRAGALYTSVADAVVTDCTFRGNTSVSGGAVYARGLRAHYVNCLFERNAAVNGGAAFIDAQSVRFTSCTFNGNSATVAEDSWNEGRGGAIHGVSRRTVALANCVLTGNVAYTGGAIWKKDYRLTVTNCTLVGNTALERGGAIRLWEPSRPSTIDNSILWGNVAGSEGSQIFADSLTAISYSLIQDSGGSLSWDIRLGTDAGNNIDANPMFVRPSDDGGDGWGDDPETPGVDEGANDDYGDLHLQGASPCIDAGDPAIAPEPGETDLDGYPRVLCDRVDMGAYEFGIGDYDCDQVVGLGDFAQWAACLTEPNGGPIAPGCEAFDFNADADVDLDDYAGFQAMFAGL